MDFVKELIKQLDVNDVPGLDKGDFEKIVSIFNEKASSDSSFFTNMLTSGSITNAVEELSKLSGVDSNKLTECLPALIAKFGAIFQNQGLGAILESFGSMSNSKNPDSSGLGSILSAVLDSDKDGKISDDILEAAKKLI